MGVFGSKKKKGKDIYNAGLVSTTSGSDGGGRSREAQGSGNRAAFPQKTLGSGSGAQATHNLTRSMSISTPSKKKNIRFKSAAIAVIAANRLMRVKPQGNQKCMKLVAEHYGCRAGSVKPAVLEQYVKDNRLELIETSPYKRQNLLMTVGSHLVYVAENS